MQLVGLAKAGPAQSFRSHKPGKQRQQTTRLQAAQQGVPSLKRVKKADLQEQLSAFGLSTDGKREELASRLEIHLSHLSHLEARALEQQSKQDEQSEVLDDVKEVAIDKLEDTTLTLDSLLSRTKAQLSTELASRGLPKSGLKADLAQRLFEAIETEGSSNDITDLPIESDAAAAGIDPLEAETQTAPGSVEPEQATSILDLVQSADPEEDTSHQIAPVPDYDAPDEDIATEGDSPPISLLEEPVPREQQPGILRDAEGTVIRANFGSGARTQDRFENAGTRAADVAESEMSPMGLEEDAQDGTNKAFQELQTEDTMDDEADTFVSEQRAGVGFDSPGDTGYKETIGPAGQVVIDSMQDPEAAELGMPGEDEAADPPENDAYAAAPDTLEELDAQLDEQQDEINAIQEERITDVTYPEEEARTASEARIAAQHARARAVLEEAATDPSPQPSMHAAESSTTSSSQRSQSPPAGSLPSSSGNIGGSNSSRMQDVVLDPAAPSFAFHDDAFGTPPELSGSQDAAQTETLEPSAGSDTTATPAGPSLVAPDNATNVTQLDAASAAGIQSDGAGESHGSNAADGVQNAAQTVSPEPGATSEMTATPAGAKEEAATADDWELSPLAAAPNSADLTQAAMTGLAARNEGITSSAKSEPSFGDTNSLVPGSMSSPSSHASARAIDPELTDPWNDQAYAESESTLGTVEPQTEDPELEASSERLATPAGTPQHGEAYASKLPFTGKSADAAAPSPSDLSQAAIAGRNARSESTAATPAANSLASDVSTGLASEAHDKLSGSTAVGSSAPESHTSAAASQGPQGSSILQTEDAELESPGQDDQTPQARGADFHEWSDAGTASNASGSSGASAEAQGDGVSLPQVLDASAATSTAPELSGRTESRATPQRCEPDTASGAAGGQLSDELTQMQSKVDSRNEDVKQLQEKLAASHQEAADHTASIENMQAEMAQLRNEHVALSRQLEQTSHSHGPVSPYIKEELSKQLTALSSQVSHLQGEIMRRGQLSGQLHEQLQADLPVSYINGRASLSDPIGAISLRPSPTQSLITQETVSPTDTSKTSEQETATEQNQAGASSVDVDDQARQPGVVVAAGAMEFMRVGSKVSEAMGSVFNIFKQGLKGRKDD
ncbi:hypothetical protein WJX74_010827 [Apatococcus lobatus]|uniref:SAP domain-containing protein n=1 Tax=Apatococcus lobatus TaxID=904363 RepID=A0AAW1RQI7_9CHLO